MPLVRRAPTLGHGIARSTQLRLLLPLEDVRSPIVKTPHHPAPGQPLLVRVVITDEDHRVLIVPTAGSRTRWGLPGGLVHLNESPRAAARRETA